VRTSQVTIRKMESAEVMDDAELRERKVFRVLVGAMAEPVCEDEESLVCICLHSKLRGAPIDQGCSLYERAPQILHWMHATQPHLPHTQSSSSACQRCCDLRRYTTQPNRKLNHKALSSNESLLLQINELQPSSALAS
jgi:hypothetical protein